jgi:integrase/recombinase XerD
MISLRESVTDYLSMRRSLGFKMKDAGVGLLDFISYTEQTEISHITTAVALLWAQQKTTVQPQEWARRLSFVRGFARYHLANDSRTEIPPSSLLQYRPKRAQPYLYTDDEVQKIMSAAQTLPPANGFRGQTYCCLLGLLSVSGMRIGEILNLKLKNVDFTEGVIKVVDAKFGKSRLVPLHASTLKALADYKMSRAKFLAGKQAEHFFISLRGNCLDKGQVTRTFHLLSRQTGLRKLEASNGPRLHDFRHVFAIQTMLRWYRCGADVERLLPVLSSYLGHVHISDTYWYFSACPELMGMAVKLLEQRWEEI